VANGGFHDGSEGERNMASRYFKTATCGTDASEECGVSTLYVRYYVKWASGYEFGAEKHINFTNNDGDIAFANIQLNCGSGGRSSTGDLAIQVIHGEDMCDPVGFEFSSGIWYFVEMRVTAHASNGIIQVWINDCGTDGTTCGASPTLRYNQSGLQLPGNSNGSQIGMMWFESWANPGSLGTGPYWDQVKASIVGPIGFAGQEQEQQPEASTLKPAMLMMVMLALMWGYLIWRSRSLTARSSG
jgi:hypothetical protein